MWYWLICLALLCALGGCSTITQWRQRNSLTQLNRIFTECEARQKLNDTSNWTAAVRCGNDGAQAILVHGRLPYVDLIEAALASRLAIAQQLDAGVVSPEEGQTRLAAINTQIRLLPGSMMDLLRQTAAARPQ